MQYNCVLMQLDRHVTVDHKFRAFPRRQLEHVSHSCVRRTRNRLERELPGCPFRWLTSARLRLAQCARVDDSG